MTVDRKRETKELRSEGSFLSEHSLLELRESGNNQMKASRLGRSFVSRDSSARMSHQCSTIRARA